MDVPSRTEQNICVCEQALFDRDGDGLGALEAGTEELPDVLRGREVEGDVDFV
jgi:hypothetical protein